MEELQKIYKKEGLDFINDLLNDYIIITEKLSGSSFAFEVHDGNINFFKGNSHKPLSLVDRTIMMYYEPAVQHINKSVDIKIVPNNWRFCFQYFVHNEPGVIEYTILPKNNLVLTHIHIKDDNGKTAKIIDDPRVIKDWATKLNVTPLQPFFIGYLNEEQKNKIKEFISIPVEDQEELFGTSSFVEYLLYVLNPEVLSTTLHGDLKNPIDSLVFKFIKPGTGRTISAKLIDPYARALMKKKDPIDIRRVPADINEIILLDLLAFIEERGIQKSDTMNTNTDQRYIELISVLFNDYIKNRDLDFNGIEFDKASFASGPEFNLNLDLIQNSKTNELVRSSETLADLYKVMLGSLRKKRNPEKAGSVMTSSVVNDFNKLVDKIQKITSRKDTEEFKTFDEYLQLKKINESIEDPIEVVKEEKLLNYAQFVNIKSVNLKEGLKVPHTKSGNQKVNMIVGRFQPFTEGHAKVFKQLHKQNGLPVVVFTVRGKKPNLEKTPFDEEIQHAMFAKMQKDYPFLEAMYIAPSAGIDTLYSMLRPAYEPILWGFGTDRKKAYGNMITKPEYREQLGVDPNFSGYEIKRADEDISASKVREAIKLDDKATFHKMTPKSIHDMYEILQTILEPVSESILTEDLVKVQVGTKNVGTLDTNDSEAISDIKKITTSASITLKLNEFLSNIGVPVKYHKQIGLILGGGDVSKIAKYIENRTLMISDILNKNANAISITEKLLGMDTKSSVDLFSFQWPTAGMGKGEFWLAMMLNGGSLRGVGDVNVNDNAMEVKGIGARLVGQHGYGSGQSIPKAYINALQEIAEELGATDYEVIIPKNEIEWNVTKKEGRMLSSNLEAIAKSIGGFDKKSISLISRKIVEAYKALYINLNPAQYSNILESSIDKNGKINANEFNIQLLIMSFDYYYQIESFKYFAITNHKSGTTLVIEPTEFKRLVLNKTIAYTPPTWSRSGGTQGPFFGITIK
tara:strand:+ start:13124 stop:16030 length:2907 start_codon:yes stop_codon:yes gene_type:complete